MDFNTSPALVMAQSRSGITGEVALFRHGLNLKSGFSTTAPRPPGANNERAPRAPHRPRPRRAYFRGRARRLWRQRLRVVRWVAGLAARFARGCRVAWDVPRVRVARGFRIAVGCNSPAAFRCCGQGCAPTPPAPGGKPFMITSLFAFSLMVGLVFGRLSVTVPRARWRRAWSALVARNARPI